MFLLVYIVVVGVVASQGDERAQAQAIGKEDLSCCIQPHLLDNRYMCVSLCLSAYEHVLCDWTVYLRPDELIEVWSDVEEDPINGSRQSDPTEEQDEQHKVRISGWKIHHLRETERERKREQPLFNIQMKDFYSVKAKNTCLI